MPDNNFNYFHLKKKKREYNIIEQISNTRTKKLQSIRKI